MARARRSATVALMAFRTEKVIYWIMEAEGTGASYREWVEESLTR